MVSNADTLTGRLLVASPTLIEATFHRTVIMVIDHGVEGAAGLILNRPSDQTVEEHLPDWSHLGGGPIFLGGPVEPDVGVCVSSGATGDDSLLPGLSLLDLTLAPPGSGAVRIYAGYSGWAEGQLEAELAEGAWYVVPAAPDDPFGDPDGMWERILRRQPGRLAMVATFPEDPHLN